MARAQPAILAPLTRHARWMFFDLAPGGDVHSALRALAGTTHGDDLVSGIGLPAVVALGADVPGLQTFPALARGDVSVPSTQAALACWVRGDDRGEILHRGRALARSVAGGFRLREHIDAFVFTDSRDLTGYEDGTENPKGDAATKAAVAGGDLVGSSFVAVQRWVHDLKQFRSHGQRERDAMIGRRQDTNEEIADAPAWAHVKRTDQIAAYQPPVFIVRRSMPWASGTEQGLEFIAYGRTLDFFERHLRRMVGLDDGIADALFRFSRAVAGSYYWCPPVAGGKLDLSHVLGE